MGQQKHDLTPAQYDAVKDDTKRLRILAGAGSGKTRVLTHRIAHQSRALRIEPEHVLCLTFTKKAAEELSGRLRTLGLSNPVTAGTFHALAYAQLKTRWKDLGLSRTPSILENRKAILGSILPKQLAFDTRESIVNEINWATSRRLTPETYSAAAESTRRNLPNGTSQISEFMRLFSQEKKKRNLLDFDDILENAISDLAKDTEYAAGRHWKYRYIFVDEFQDVNPLQFALLRAWLGPDSSICVVGDPNQAIYSWNGADAKYLENFATYFPGSRTIELTENFRSSPEIIKSASSLLKKKVELNAQKPSGETPSLHQAKNCSDEAEYIARSILENRRFNEGWSRQAVLVRTHAQISQIADTLSRFSIPCSVPSSRETSPETKNSHIESDSVTIATFHAAKGLEWPIVYIA
ncbi:MAG: UvrD-helicase domain-containing protein, partial [Acidimicrobiales bacterium]|nr:UvrD-helicase domain-containing protein [Acidimicrobiales bacterium]